MTIFGPHKTELLNIVNVICVISCFKIQKLYFEISDTLLINEFQNRGFETQIYSYSYYFKYLK